MTVIKPPRPVSGFGHTKRACRTKPSYEDEGAATLKLLDVRRAGGDADRTMQPYACEHCGRWHLGHRPGTRDENGEMRGMTRAATLARRGTTY